MSRSQQTITEYLSQYGFRDASTDTLPSSDSCEPVYIAGGKKYMLRRIIAEGGMGIIYEAEEIDCRRIVALKVLPLKLSVPTEDVLRFIAEAQITSQLEHPNIVPIHELGMDSHGRVFYTMKYIRGRTLASVLIEIRKGDRETIEQYPLSRLLNAFQKVGDAVAFAHARKVIHRDIKPDNVMLGDYGEVVLMDWGLAIHAGALEELVARSGSTPTDRLTEISTIREEAGCARIKTLNDQVLGSPGFMAPEQIDHRSAVTARSDIYGLGAILYCILTLRPTVTGENIVNVLKKIITGDFPPPAYFNEPQHRKEEGLSESGEAAFPHCPDGIIPDILSDIAMKALATESEDRYPVVKDLQEEIEVYQSGLVWKPVIDEDFTQPDIEKRWDIVGGNWEMRDGTLV
ncbi:MAG: serine/threonine-protein kinase, partial [Lentisphaerota bacterium]